LLTLTSGSTSGQFRFYNHTTNGGRLYVGGVIKCCFAIPDVTSINAHWGTSNNGSASWGLGIDTSLNGGNFYFFAGNNAAVTTNLGIAAAAGNFVSGTRYIGELYRVSLTQTRIVLKSAPWDSAVWTTLYDQTVTHSAVTPATNSPHIAVIPLSNSARVIMADWYSQSFPATR